MEDEVIEDDTNQHEMLDAFAKIVLGTAAGFIANRLVVHLYESAVTAYRNR